MLKDASPRLPFRRERNGVQRLQEPCFHSDDLSAFFLISLLLTSISSTDLTHL